MPPDEFDPPDEVDREFYRIRKRHDDFREILTGGVVLIPDQAIFQMGLYEKVLKALREYRDFELDDILHETGAMIVDDHRIRWTIRCRNSRDLSEAAPDPGNFAETTLILEILLQPS